MSKTSYSDKLKDPRWQKKRLKILERDDFTCTKCGDNSETLHVHHYYYEKGFEPWDYHIDSLTTYCSTCHFIVEKFKYFVFESSEISSIVKTEKFIAGYRVVIVTTDVLYEDCRKTCFLKVSIRLASIVPIIVLPSDLLIEMFRKEQIIVDQKNLIF